MKHLVAWSLVKRRFTRHLTKFQTRLMGKINALLLFKASLILHIHVHTFVRLKHYNVWLQVSKIKIARLDVSINIDAETSTLYTDFCIYAIIVTHIVIVRVWNKHHPSKILFSCSNSVIFSVVRNDVTSKLRYERIHRYKRNRIVQQFLLFLNT